MISHAALSRPLSSIHVCGAVSSSGISPVPNQEGVAHLHPDSRRVEQIGAMMRFEDIGTAWQSLHRFLLRAL